MIFNGMACPVFQNSISRNHVLKITCYVYVWNRIPAQRSSPVPILPSKAPANTQSPRLSPAMDQQMASPQPPGGLELAKQKEK
jgi:hypothetical protein